jgi:SOS-response transcriptional repressor LexA
VAKTKGASNPELRRVLTDAMASRPGLSQTALAKKAGVSQSTISRMMRGVVNSQSDNERSVFEALGISAFRFVESSTEPEGGKVAGASRERGGASRTVPIISYVQAGRFGETVDPYLPGDGSAWEPCPVPCGPKTFGLRVMGESMEPRYHNGDIIFVDPDVPPLHGSAVVVRLKDSNEATFKQLVIEGTRRYLKPLNPRFPVIEITTEAHIVGVVIGGSFSTIPVTES